MQDGVRADELLADDESGGRVVPINGLGLRASEPGARWWWWWVIVATAGLKLRLRSTSPRTW